MRNSTDEAVLEACHEKSEANKAVGIDGVTKLQYSENLQENIEGLVARMKSQTYKPQPVRRAYIPKADGNKKRPLGIPAYEDKLVQKALNDILTAIYETEFLDCSYGFRPGRSCHYAIKAVGKIIENRKVSYIVDNDIKGFFDNVDHEWMMKFLGERIKDPNLLKLISRFLKAGVMEQGERHATDQGTPQGGPTLANVYLHYVLDLWFIVKVRLKKFNLEIAEEKTKIIEFGRYAEERRGEKGDSKPETFDFLGFTCYALL